MGYAGQVGSTVIMAARRSRGIGESGGAYDCKLRRTSFQQDDARTVGQWALQTMDSEQQQLGARKGRGR